MLLKRIFSPSPPPPPPPSVVEKRGFTRKENNYNVSICGAGGGIGQAMSLLLKLNPYVDSLHLHDIGVGMEGIAADLSHIETVARVKSYVGSDKLRECMDGCHVIMICAGVPRKPGMTRDDMFDINAKIVKNLAKTSVEVAPKALVGVVTDPINSIIPVICEIYKEAGKETTRVFGITTLDAVRANTFTSEMKDFHPRDVNVPVIGGHSGETIVPLFSRMTPRMKFSDSELKTLIHRIREAGTEIVEAKKGTGASSLCMAYAAARFANSMFLGLNGSYNVVENAYVASEVTELPYFASPVVLGQNGIERHMGIGELNDLELKMVQAAIPELKKNIEKGIKFVKQNK